MSIQEHLNKIRNAIKGSEVRESIAKGIETAYDDASENGNANMEVKIARGTHPNLRSRLEEVDNKQQETTAQLAQKVGGGTKAELEDLSSTLLSAIEGGEGTSFNLLSVPQDKSVTPIKTDFIHVSSNFYNPRKAKDGYGVRTDGSEFEHEDYKATEYIDTYPGQKISIRGFNRIVYFGRTGNESIDYTTIESDADGVVIDIPVNIYRFRASGLKTRVDAYGQINKSSSFLPYEPFYLKLDEQIEIKEEQIEIKEEVKKDLITTPEKISGIYRAKADNYFDVDYKVLERLYEGFENLYTQHPEYISRELYSQDYTGEYPIYLYTLKTEEMSTSVLGETRPTILLHGAIHGEERPSSIALYHMTKALCEDWKESSILEFLRFNTEIKFIPVVNPYGYKTHNRLNGNGVNIQKNAGYDHNPSQTDSGASAWSEIETRNIKRMIDSNTDAILYVDLHSADLGYDSIQQFLPDDYNYNEDLEIASKYQIELMTREFKKNYAVPDSITSNHHDGDNMIGWINRNNMSNIKYGNDKGIPSMLVELMYRFPYETEQYSSDVMKANSEYLINWLSTYIKQVQ